MSGLEVGNMQKGHTAFAFGYKVEKAVVLVNVACFELAGPLSRGSMPETATTNGDEFLLAGRHTVVHDGSNMDRVLNASDGCFQRFAVEVKE